MGERELQLRMELLFEDSITDHGYRMFEPAKRLAVFSLSEQDRFLKAAERLARKSPGLARSLCLKGVAAMSELTETGWNEWIATLDRQLDGNGENAAIAYLENLDSHLQTVKPLPQEVTLEAIAPTIERLVTALGGHRLAVEAHKDTFTDTERIYLPKRHSLFDNADKNFALYKASSVFMWAQNEFGTWRIEITRLLYDEPDSDKATKLFRALETLRLDACIERELPGVARVMTELGKQSARLPKDERWLRAAHDLARADATARDSLDKINTLYRAPMPQPTLYQGTFKPLVVMRAIKKRIAAARTETEKQLPEPGDRTNSDGKPKLTLDVNRGKAEIYRFKPSDEGKEVEATPGVEPLPKPAAQDSGQHFKKEPEDRHRAGEESVKPGKAPGPDGKKEDGAATLLPEWDHSVQRYRHDWCRVFRREIAAGNRDFVTETLSRHRGLLKRLGRIFEALREGDALHLREPHGDNVNLDAAIEAAVAIRRGEEPEADAYTRHKKTGRDIAVAFITDMSGSTSGWVNRTEKEALVLLCESLETLGDCYAIYGFSGRTRERCDIFEIKSFAESYGEEVQKKISGITPRDYTRMGAAIRFVHAELLRTEARTRIMVTLSDGRPDDRDGYRGPYGIEDTRRALLETKFRGIHPYCVTINRETADYLPYMYGPANFSIVDRVEKLPFRMSDVYRRITS